MSAEWLHEVLSDDNGLPLTPYDIEAAEVVLAQYAALFAVTPPLSMRSKILNAIANIDGFPWLQASDQRADWAKRVAYIPAPDRLDGVYLHPLIENAERSLFVAWVQKEVPLEVHFDLIESYLLLEGTCSCQVQRLNGTLETVQLAPGDCFKVAIGEAHALVVTSEQPVKAILQWHKQPFAA